MPVGGSEVINDSQPFDLLRSLMAMALSTIERAIAPLEVRECFE